jgi:cytochrome c-type biogenesis protein CcmE
MKARSKFLVGGALVLGTSGYLMASSIEETAQYYLTPGELAAKVADDPSFRENGVKIGARVVSGTIKRDPGGRSLTFKMTDGKQTYDVAYRGIAPDTFTDGVDVVVEGRLGADGVFRATTLLAKCASRYENAPEKGGAYGGAAGKHPANVPMTGGYGPPGAAPAGPAAPAAPSPAPTPSAPPSGS